MKPYHSKLLSQQGLFIFSITLKQPKTTPNTWHHLPPPSFTITRHNYYHLSLHISPRNGLSVRLERASNY